MLTIASGIPALGEKEHIASKLKAINTEDNLPRIKRPLVKGLPLMCSVALRNS